MTLATTSELRTELTEQEESAQVEVVGPVTHRQGVQLRDALMEALDLADPEKMKARVEHDIYYTDNWSPLFDLQVLAMTAFIVLSQKNGY